MRRNLNRKVGIYVSRLGELKYAARDSPTAAGISTLKAGYRLCASVDNADWAASILNSTICQKRGHGVYIIDSPVTFPTLTRAELEAIGELIENEYQRQLHEKEEIL